MKSSKKTILISVLILSILAGITYFWATAMVDAIYAYRSPISSTTSPFIESTSEPLTRRVVIVLVDALRLDTADDKEIMPFLNQLRESGASAIMHSQTPSFSAPGYSTLLTGSWPYINDGPAFNLEYEDIPILTQDQIFAAAHRGNLKTAISGYYWFEKLVPSEDVTKSYYTAGEDRHADDDVVSHALPWLDDPSISLVLIHIDQVDYAGHHEGGAKSIAWKEAARRSDDLIKEITEKLDLTQDTILVISDHGQIDPGGHGGHENVVLTEPFVINGSGILPGKYYDIQMIDVAPTVAGLLGLSLPASAQGKPLFRILNMSTQDQASYQEQQTILQNNLSAVYAKAIHIPDITTGSDAISTLRQMRLTKERIARGILPLSYIVGLLFFFFYRKTNIGSVLVGSLVFLLIFNFRYLLLDGRSYSFSTIDTPTNLILYIAVTSLVALAVASLVYLWMNRRRGSTIADTIQAELSFAISLDCLLLIPPIWHAWWNGILPTWTLPDFRVYFVGLFFLIQLLIVSVAGILFAFFTGLFQRIIHKPVQ